MAKLDKYVHMMVDTETYALDDHAVVLSVGISVCSSEWVELSSFYINIDIDEQVAAGRSIDDKTVEWWAKQSPRAVNKIFANEKYPQLDCEIAAVQLYAYIMGIRKRFDNKVLYWGNSAQFDINKLNSFLYDFVPSNKYDIGIEFINNYYTRCFKTTRDIAESYYGVVYKREDVLHYALADARQQCEFMKKLVAFSPMIKPVTETMERLNQKGTITQEPILIDF